MFDSGDDRSRSTPHTDLVMLLSDPETAAPSERGAEKRRKAVTAYAEILAANMRSLGDWYSNMAVALGPFGFAARNYQELCYAGSKAIEKGGDSIVSESIALGGILFPPKNYSGNIPQLTPREISIISQEFSRFFLCHFPGQGSSHLYRE